MKILHYDDVVLQLRLRGGAVLLVLGILALGSSPLWAPVVGQSTTLTCDRQPSGLVECDLGRTLMTRHLNSQPLHDLRGARIDDHEASDGDTMYEVVLVTADRSVPMGNHSGTNYRRYAATADVINDFFADPSADSLKVTDRNTSGLIVSAAFLLAGAGLTFAGYQLLMTTWTFDKGNATITKSRRTPVGAKLWTYPLNSVRHVRVGSSRDSDGDRTYRVELITDLGESIPMASWYSSGYARKEETANLIRQFLALD